MDYLTLGKIILAAPWLIGLSVHDFRKHELPNAWVFGGILVMAASARKTSNPFSVFSWSGRSLTAPSILSAESSTVMAPSPG